MVRWQGLITVALPRFSILENHRHQRRLSQKKENPIITPNDKNHWESEATFNPAALYEDGKVHLLYRAVGRDSVSSIGHTASNNGVNFLERGLEPAYWPREKFEGVHASRPNTNQPFLAYTSGGGGSGGCETASDFNWHTVYMIYTALTAGARCVWLCLQLNWRISKINAGIGKNRFWFRHPDKFTKLVLFPEN